jgi:ORF6N domain
MNSKLKKKTAVRILTIREQKVVLDSDLAAIYGVTTDRFNEAAKRNAKRFPKISPSSLPAESGRD